MRGAKISLLLLFAVLFFCVLSFAIDPYEINMGGFGLRVAGAQLGMKMSIADIARWRANLWGLPFTLEINSDNIPGRTPSDVGSISILFKGKGNKISEFEVTRATRNFYRYRQESLKFSDLADAINKAGIESVRIRGKDSRSRENCISFTDDMRVKSIILYKSDLSASEMSHEDFVQKLTKVYRLAEMNRRGGTWNYRNEREGWQMTYQSVGDGIFSIQPIITD